MKIKMRNVRTLIEKERYVLFVFIFLFFMKSSKLVLSIVKVKAYQRSEKAINQNEKIKPVYTMVIWDMIIA
jgi:hypothetical protein